MTEDTRPDLQGMPGERVMVDAALSWQGTLAGKTMVSTALDRLGTLDKRTLIENTMVNARRMTNDCFDGSRLS